MSDHRHVGTIMLRHPLGGTPTIKDVCARCNSQVLSTLDNAAREWWEASDGGTAPVMVGVHRTFARWLGKFVYNVQRIERREHGRTIGAAVPDYLRMWILGDLQAQGRISAWVSLFPVDHAGSLHAGIWGPDDRPDRPVWMIGLHRFFFGLAWDEPGGFAQEVRDESIIKLPAAPLDLERGEGPIDIPELHDPDFVYRSTYAAVQERLNEFERKRDARR